MLPSTPLMRAVSNSCSQLWPIGQQRSHTRGAAQDGTQHNTALSTTPTNKQHVAPLAQVSRVTPNKSFIAPRAVCQARACPLPPFTHHKQTAGRLRESPTHTTHTPESVAWLHSMLSLKSSISLYLRRKPVVVAASQSYWCLVGSYRCGCVCVCVVLQQARRC